MASDVTGFVGNSGPVEGAPGGAVEGDVPADVAAIREARAKWEKTQVARAVAKSPLRAPTFSTLSDVEVPDVVTPAELQVDYLRDLGLPGEYPYTRGIQPTMYRGRLWTMRQFAGFGTPEQTNQRYHYLLANGQMGLSVAFDFPTLMGYDSDSPRSLGEVGMCGVAVDTLRDMEVLFDGIPLDKITTSMTINGPAIVLFCFYVALADQRGIARDKIGGTIQNDCLKEFIAQHAWVVGPRPAMRLVTDMIEFAAKELPRWHPVSISGYHIREAGSTAAQELAFTLADGIAYVQSAVDRGLDVDTFAPRLSFFFDVHIDFFEEIAKFRAARRIWARTMRERFGAKLPESWKLKTHAQTAGVSLTAQQPYNNVARVAIQALAAVLGGTQSLHTNSLDETYALPTEEAVTIALRTQQIVAHETGVASTIDPLGGSYYVEWLTNKIEAEAMQYIARIDALGGMVNAVEKGFPQREIASAAYRFQRQVERREKVMVGVNDFVNATEDAKIPLLKIDEAVQRQQTEALGGVKARRDPRLVAARLDAVREAARTGANLCPPIIEAAKVYCTEQELCDVLREVFGTHTDPAEF
ncbi:MAG: methylmalonyl-CoA mutase family protein [Myxococcales bacterium]|nr:methylmalonyl-CoA mutase family protein [Myxococcales bacterium]